MKQTKLFLSLLMLLTFSIGNMWGADVTGTITFGKNSVNINEASVTATDNQSNSWTINTAGTSSFTNTNATYVQIGSKDKPATSITFVGTLSAEKNITKVTAKFGGFSKTAGNVSIKVGDTEIGSGELDETTDVTINSTTAATGKTITISITDIARGVKCYNITYTYSDGGSTEEATLSSISISGTPTKTEYVVGERFDPAGLIVTGTYDDDTEKEIAADDITWNYYPTEPLKPSDNKVTISATVQGVVSDAIEIPITVTEAPKFVTFDLTKDETKTASEETLTWEKENIASMTLEKEKSSTNANNFYPNKDNSNAHTRFYKDQVWTITPATGKSVTKIEVITTGSNYATKLANSTFTNATAEAISSNVIITPKDDEDAISCTISEATRINTITIYYAEAVNPKITCDSRLELTDTEVSTTTFPITFERAELVSIALFTDAKCTTKFTDSWFLVSVAEEAPFTISYLAEANTDAKRTVYMKIEAINGTSGSITAQKVVTVTQAKGVPTFTSLEELAKADITTNTIVRVTFTNAVIKEIATNSSGYRRGIYFDIQKEGEDIEIYYPYTAVPAEWVQGGKLSGTMTCPWTKYNDTWELAPEKDSWNWDRLTYTEPAAIDHIVISGEATKTEYTEGETFDYTGLVVKAVDTENGETDVTSLTTWSFEPAVLTLGTTSVKATASYNSKTANISIPVTVKALSEEYTFTSLEDLAKAEIPSETMVKVSFSAEIKAFTKAKNGVYFNIQKEDEDIKIYYPTTNIPEEWEVGGSLSGTIVAPWQRFESYGKFQCWELAPKKGTWDWTELTYTSAPKVLSIAIEGTPNTTYTEGDIFSTEGLTVEATLDNNTTKDVTNYVTWEITPSTALTTTTISVSVKAVYEEIESEPVSYKITVQEKQMEGEPIVIVFEYNDSYYALKTDLGVYTFPKGAGVVAGKMVNIPETERANITWYRASAEGGVTFQRKSDGQYLTAGSSTKLSASTTPCIWSLQDGYYTASTTASDIRTLLYQAGNINMIRYYQVSSAGATNYSGYAMYLSEYIDGEIADVRKLNGNIGTLCLAKKVIAFEGAKFYRIYSKDAEVSASVKNVTFEEITETLEAGEACIFEPEDNATQIRVVYMGDAVTAPLTGNGLVGIFENVDDLRAYTENKGVDYADVFVVQNNRIRKAGEGLTSEPNRAYINMSQVGCNVPQKAGRRYIVLGKENTGTTTGIDDVQTDNAPLGTYDVLGRKVGETSAAGLYIINGKKVLIVK